MSDYFVHESSYVDDGAVVGRGTGIASGREAISGSISKNE